ncbi:MAG: BirA family transcriptional regulator, biotin operon repressor/biotin---[acetyl-CoA-carboxylase] ligase [Thiomicrorhabdus sp.]|nr:MAG: BirA family transcriptional regulator, biotin operon repressor/biotin---[acetyl-CoA-carboxylase] ligase [Thiomicrorhabdus sp.]
MFNFSELERLFYRQFPSLTFYGLSTVDSTNAFLKRACKSSLEPTICITHNQTDGYGQRSREWISNEESLTFSLLSKLSVPIHEIDGLSQCIGLCIANALSQISMKNLSIKWPNDIYSEIGKVAGLLIECVNYSKVDCWLVVGIGINFSDISLDNSAKTCSTSTADYIELSSESAAFTDVLINIISNLNNLFACYNQQTFASRFQEYQKYDYFELEQEVIVYDTGQSIIGRYKGLSKRGELLFESSGSLSVYRSGEISVRSIT